MLIHSEYTGPGRFHNRNRINRMAVPSLDVQEGTQLFNQPWNLVACDIPELLGVDYPITMRQQVTETDDLTPRDPWLALFPLVGQARSRFANDEHLALHRRTFLVIRRKCLERHAAREAEYCVTSRDDVGDVEK